MGTRFCGYLCKVSFRKRDSPDTLRTVFVMAAIVTVELAQFVPLSASDAYELLCDWEDHGRWVPFTRVVVHDKTSFTAYTGVGPLALKDEMMVVSRDDSQRKVMIEKLGPIITGTASFSVRPCAQAGCVVRWRESIRVPLVPGFVAPPLRAATRALFRHALRSLA